VSERLPPVCILAGGLGTRLGSRVETIPKPLLDVAGEPFLIHQLRLLARHGATRVVLCVGYLGEQIERRLGSSQFGIDIAYAYDGPTPIGTLGAVRQALPALGERFLILYGDTYLQIDYGAVAGEWRHSGLLGLMTVLRNRGRWDTSNADFDGRRVTVYDKRAPTAAMQWIDYGLGGLQAEAVDLIGADAADLSDLYRELAATDELFGVAASERFYEIGTPDSLAETSEFLSAAREAGAIQPVDDPRRRRR
jgi:MurNAc alpha-1-phosphate uridylyltransferase